MHVTKLLDELLGKDRGASCPAWPPDVFAVVATIVERTAYHLRLPVNAGELNELLGQAAKAGSIWGNDLEHVPDEIKKRWDVICTREERIRNQFDQIEGATNTGDDLSVAAMFLLVATDEACRGIGFMKHKEDAEYINVVGWVYLESFRDFAERPNASDRYLPYLPWSLCKQVKPTFACVQPKGLAPVVGWSLGRFCNHLALLPTPNSAKTNWFPYLLNRLDHDDSDGTLNVLIVPLPYATSGRDFMAVQDESGLCRGLSGPDSGYVTSRNRPSREQAIEDGKQIGEFLTQLVVQAREDVGRVHLVVLPELALNALEVEHVIRALNEIARLSLFVAGVESNSSEGRPHNLVYFHYLNGGPSNPQGGTAEQDWFVQHKHHPWQVDESQIREYSLGHALPLKKRHWWEYMQIKERVCNFVGLDYDVCMTALICEDLARIEPAQQTLRAIGPNLVVGLLMDGPQLPSRWPARYATVLADDPGCSVLTLTSLALVRRSMERRNQSGDYAIGLWKEFGEGVQELMMPRTAHGLVLSLSMVREKAYTPDGRPDTFAKGADGSESGEGATVRIRLMGTQTVAVPEYTTPDRTNRRYPALAAKLKEGTNKGAFELGTTFAADEQSSWTDALLKRLDEEGPIPSGRYYLGVHGEMRRALEGRNSKALEDALRWLKARPQTGAVEAKG